MRTTLTAIGLSPARAASDDRSGSRVPVKRQAELLDLNRSSVYYRPRALPERDLILMRRIDELHLELPYYGSRKLADRLRREGHELGRRHVRTLMRRMRKGFITGFLRGTEP
jgi:hypothetical protein